MSALFRREAIDGQRLAWLGEVRLLPPPSLTLLTGVVAATAAAVVVFLLHAEVTPKARLPGVIVSGAPADHDSGAHALHAALCASPATVGLLRPGQSVRLQYEAFGPSLAAQAPAGRIAHVARSPARPHEDDACGGAAPEGGTSYLVVVPLVSQTVEVDAAPQKLEAGMRLRAEVLLERRRLTHWMFGGGPVAPGRDD